MRGRVFWSVTGIAVILLLVGIYAHPHMIRDAFEWALHHPFVPLSAGCAVFSIYGLLGRKELRSALAFQSLAVGLMFHRQVAWFLGQFFQSLASWWRAL